MRKRWWHLGPAHCTNTCHAHCTSGIQSNASHNFYSFTNRSATTLATNSPDPTGVPKILTPSGLQTSGPNTRQLCSTWRRIPAMVDNLSPNRLKMERTGVASTPHRHRPGTSFNALWMAKLKTCSPPSCCSMVCRCPASSSHEYDASDEYACLTKGSKLWSPGTSRNLDNMVALKTWS